jgi:hypothetical protein
MLKTEARHTLFWSFEFWSLILVSDFVLRISDFPILLEWNTDQCAELLTSCDVNEI